MKKGRFVILDRDGTIIVEKNYLSDPDEVELLPGAAKGLKRMREMGLGLVVITNQSAIGRGFLDTARLAQIHERMRRLLEEQGVFLNGIYFCPHLPEKACDCRKPGTALLELAGRELEFCVRHSFVVGDKECDIALGKRAGATTFLVLTGYGEDTLAKTKEKPDFVVKDLDGAATIIESRIVSAKEEKK